VMNKAHQKLPERRSISVPKGVTQISYCTETGKRAGETCPADSYYYATSNLPGSCGVEHPLEEEEGEEGAEGEEGLAAPSTTPSPGGGTPPTATGNGTTLVE